MCLLTEELHPSILSIYNLEKVQHLDWNRNISLGTIIAAPYEETNVLFDK